MRQPTRRVLPPKCISTRSSRLGEDSRHIAAHHHSSHDMRVPFGRRPVLPPRNVHRSPWLATPYIPTQGVRLLFITYMALISHVYARTFPFLSAVKPACGLLK